MYSCHWAINVNSQIFFNCQIHTYPYIRQNPWVVCKGGAVIYQVFIIFSAELLLACRRRRCPFPHSRGFWTTHVVWNEYKNALLAPRIILHHVLFLLGQRVGVYDGRIRVGGRLKVSPPVFSLVRVKLHASPRCLLGFHLWTFDCFVWSLFLFYRFWFVLILSFNWNWLYIVVSFRFLVF